MQSLLRIRQRLWKLRTQNISKVMKEHGYRYIFRHSYLWDHVIMELQLGLNVIFLLEKITQKTGYL